MVIRGSESLSDHFGIRLPQSDLEHIMKPKKTNEAKRKLDGEKNQKQLLLFKKINDVPQIMPKLLEIY